MPGRRADPFKPNPGTSYSKGQVNRAGELLRRYFYDPGGDEIGIDDVFDGYTTVTWWRELHAKPLSRVAVNLRYHVAKADAQLDGRIDVAQRLKKRPTMIDKLERERRMDLTQMHDIGGVRARLPSQRHVYAVSRRLKKSWTIVRTKDYIEDPKESGYRALHHAVRRNGRIIEVQLRTFRQDAWANQVEDDGRNLDVGLKFGFGSDDLRSYYRAIADAFAHMDRGEALSRELVEEINERYREVRDRLGRRQR